MPAKTYHLYCSVFCNFAQFEPYEQGRNLYRSLPTRMLKIIRSKGYIKPSIEASHLFFLDAKFEPYEQGHYRLQKCDFLLDIDAQLRAIDYPSVFLYILRH
jgi:hypothetical protein